MKRTQTVVPLGLPSDAKSAAFVAQQVAQVARLCPAGRSVALLDIDGGNPSLRGAVEAAVGAERCVMLDTRAAWPAQVMRWEIPDRGKLSAPIEFAIVLSPVASYLAALRTVYDRFPGRPPVILPYAQTDQAMGSPRPALVSLGDDSPVMFVFIPNCGTHRMEPVVRALLDWFEKRRIQGINAAEHRRLIASIDGAPRAVFAENRPIRQVLNEYYLRFVELMDLDTCADLHDHLPAEMMAQAEFCKFVALYRDPRDYINSLYHWFCDPRHGDQFGRLPSMSKEDGLLALFEGFSDRSPAGDRVSEVPSLASAARNFVALRRHPNIFPVSYEEIRLDPRPLYRRMIAWLGLDDVVFKPIPDAVLDEAISFGSFSVQSGGLLQEGKADGYYKEATLGRSPLRKGIVGDWKNHFSPRVKERAKALIGAELIELGYEKDLDW